MDEASKGLFFTLTPQKMTDLKQFVVSCYNRNTDATIYHDQLVDAKDETDARRKADQVHTKRLLNLPSDTVRRYEVTPVEGAR